MQESMILAVIGAVVGAIALGFALVIFASILKESMGTPKMKELSEAIQEGCHGFSKPPV